MIESLTKSTAADVRAIIDRLHADRERYRRAKRIVEEGSCDLAISEATRALAIINRRATEALDGTPGVRPIADELAQWMSASDGKLELSTAEIRAAGLEILENRRRRATEAEDQRAANTLTERLAERDAEHRLDLRRIVQLADALRVAGVAIPEGLASDQLAERPVLSADEVRAVVREAAGDYPYRPRVEVTAARVAEKLAGRAVDPVQREADLREAYLAGALRAEGACRIDQGSGEYAAQIIPPSVHEITAAAAEYARSKAGG